jgi:hypothetical protein
VKLGVLLFGYGLHHRVNGALYPLKIIAANLVKGGGLQMLDDFSPAPDESIAQ